MCVWIKRTRIYIYITYYDCTGALSIRDRCPSTEQPAATAALRFHLFNDLSILFLPSSRTTCTNMARMGALTFRSLPALLGNGIHRGVRVSIRNPIEMVVAVLLLASFSYFTLYNLARTSDILSGTSNTRRRLYPATIVYPAAAAAASSMALNHSKQDSFENALRIHLIQIAVSDPSHNSTAMAHLNHAIMHQVAVPDDNHATTRPQFSYSQDLCYQPSGSNGCSELSALTRDNNDDTLVTLWYALDGTSLFRRGLVRQWTHKIQQLPPIGNLVSQESQEKKENVLACAFIITRNVVLRINELIEVNVYLFM